MARRDLLSVFQIKCRASGRIIEPLRAGITSGRSIIAENETDSAGCDRVKPQVFAAPRAKVDRAREHISDLKADLDQYIASNPITGRLDDEKNPTKINLHIKDAGLRPGAIVGDVVHNLRAALDLVASELARLNNQSDKGVYFPFSMSKAEFPNAIRNKKFDRCGPDAIRLISSIEPYRGGNQYLRNLHELDIEDKHTSLITIAKAAGISCEAEIDLEGRSAPIVNAKFEKLDYHFPDDMPFAGMVLIPTLETLTLLIDKIIDDFSNMVEARKK